MTNEKEIKSPGRCLCLRGLEERCSYLRTQGYRMGLGWVSAHLGLA